MLVKVGLENGAEGRSLAYALEYPGCAVYGENEEAALAAVPAAVAEYAAWTARHNRGESWLAPGEVQAHLEESWENYTLNEDFELDTEGEIINAWFLHDWKPLSEEDVDRGLMLLEWSRANLLVVAGDLSGDMLQRRFPGERWDIAGILRHVGGSDWWYLDRLGLAFPRAQVPDNPFERLAATREALRLALPAMVGSKQVVGVAGEFWSPRKVLRRAAWHERDHIQHIQKVLSTSRTGEAWKER